MNEFVFEMLKVAVMLVALVVARYLVPWIRDQLGAARMGEIEKWATKAVEMAQQVHGDRPGADRKAVVTDYLKRLLIAKNISISDEQLNILIEAAVKEMCMQEVGQ